MKVESAPEYPGNRPKPKDNHSPVGSNQARQVANIQRLIILGLVFSSWRAYHALHIISCDGSRQLQCVLLALVIFLHIIIRAEYFTEHCCYIMHV